jgi:hypothetical protein
MRIISKQNLSFTVKTLSILIIFSLALLHQTSDAQQMFVDDAEVTTYRSFQVEAWYGSRESWFLAAVSPIEGLELGTGIGFNSRDEFKAENWILEAKFVPMDLEAKGWSAGVVSGLLFDFDGEVEEVFAYIPFTKIVLDGSSMLHLNAGLEAIQEEDWEYEFIKGIRADIGITERFMILSDAFPSCPTCSKWISPMAKDSAGWRPPLDLTSVSLLPQTASGKQIP